jgi:hypothetical protein
MSRDEGDDIPVDVEIGGVCAVGDGEAATGRAGFVVIAEAGGRWVDEVEVCGGLRDED